MMFPKRTWESFSIMTTQLILIRHTQPIIFCIFNGNYFQAGSLKIVTQRNNSSRFSSKHRPVHITKPSCFFGMGQTHELTQRVHTGLDHRSMNAFFTRAKA